MFNQRTRFHVGVKCIYAWDTFDWIGPIFGCDVPFKVRGITIMPTNFCKLYLLVKILVGMTVECKLFFTRITIHETIPCASFLREANVGNSIQGAIYLIQNGGNLISTRLKTETGNKLQLFPFFANYFKYRKFTRLCAKLKVSSAKISRNTNMLLELPFFFALFGKRL